MAALFGFGSKVPKLPKNEAFNYGKLYASTVPLPTTPSSYSGTTNYTTETGVNSGVIQYLYYLILVIVIVLLVLVIVNYTLYPIFRTVPGGKGFIPIPGTDDSKLFWLSSQSIQPIHESKTPVAKLVQNWSYLLDIQVDNPTANTGAPRILFLRGSAQKPAKTFTESDTILKIAPDFNTAIYLDKLTNDLYVAIQTIASSKVSSTTGTSASKNISKQVFVETIPIQNIPVRKSVRIGVMISSNIFEVYINGYLIRSKTFTAPVREITGSFYPPSDTILSNTARVKNLRIWNRTLSPAEFRSYGSPMDFDLKDIPDSCLA